MCGIAGCLPRAGPEGTGRWALHSPGFGGRRALIGLTLPASVNICLYLCTITMLSLGTRSMFGFIVVSPGFCVDVVQSSNELLVLVETSHVSLTSDTCRRWSVKISLTSSTNMPGESVDFAHCRPTIIDRSIWNDGGMCWRDRERSVSVKGKMFSFWLS